MKVVFLLVDLYPHMIKTTLALLLAFGVTTAFAQEPVVFSTNPESLFTSKDKKLNKNKQAAMHIMRDLLEANHWDEAPMWLTERYLQHNPAIASGRAGVMAFFGTRPKGPIPGPKDWKTKVVSVTAEGDFVVVGVQREFDNPRVPGTKYTTTWFDMWRFVDGKADEHWDYGTINAPPPGAKK
jgi:predicted SnoaL-like aldol condensation-catalyzing enzyme